MSMFNHPGETLVFILALALPIMVFFGRPYFRHWIAMREMRFERETRLAVERQGQSATEHSAIEQRLRVIEEIVTDRPNRLAREIDGLALGEGGHA
jgi:hypothetical protein